METTAGVTRSAIDAKATLRSDTEGGTIGATDDAAGRACDDCAYPNLVRSRPEANTSPPANAATSAPPKVIRAIGFDFMVLLCKGSKKNVQDIGRRRRPDVDPDSWLHK